MTTHNHSLMDSVTGIWKRRKWLLIMSFVLLFCVAASLIIALPPLYKASTVVVFGQDDISESYVTSGNSSELEQRLEVVRQSLLSRSRLQEVIEEFDLYPEMRKLYPAEAVIRRMRKDITINQQMLRQPQWGQNATFTVQIGYQGWDPDLVSQVTNGLAARFQAANEDIRTRQATRTVEFLKEQLDAARNAFLLQEQRINEFKTANLGGLPQQEGMNMATLERLNSELRLNGERQIQLMSRRSDLLLGLNEGGSSGAVTGASNVLRLERLKRELAELGNRYTENYPEIIRVRNQITELERSIAISGPDEPATADSGVPRVGDDPQQIESEYARLKAREGELRAAFQSLQDRVQNTPKVEQELQQLTNEYNLMREQYLALQERHQAAQLAESLEYQQNQQVQVLEYAVPPSFPAAPAVTQLLIMAFILAAGAALGLVFIAEQSDRTFHNLDDVRNFTRLPVLGSISRISTTGDRLRASARFVATAVIFATCVVVLSMLAYYYGQAQGQDLMWMMN